MFAPTDCTIAQCGRKNCKTCKILITDNSFSSSFTKRSFTTHSFENLSCKSTNLVNGIGCGLCGLIYVGEMKGQLRSRMNGHRFQINHGGNQLLYRHFNLHDHSILSMKVRILEKIYWYPTNNPSFSNPFRRKREEHWIRQPGTAAPYGCNYHIDIDMGNLTSSDGGSVEFHNRSSVRIGWCIWCDFADYNRFTHIHWMKYFLCPGRKFRSVWFFFLCLCVKENNWFSYITLGKTYCQSSRRVYVSETSLPWSFVVHINLVIECFVQASDDRLLKMRIDHHNQQLLWLINRLFPIIGTSLLTSPGCQSLNVLNLFDRTSRRHRSHGSRKYNKPEIHDVSFDGLLPFVNLQLGLHNIRTKLYSLPLKRLQALYESTLTLQFADVGSPGHRLQGIILDISPNRLFKAVRVDEPTETRNRPFLNVKFANKGIDALNVSNILNKKFVQNKIPPYFQYKESPCISYSYTRSVASKIFNYI